MVALVHPNLKKNKVDNQMAKDWNNIVYQVLETVVV